MRFIETLDGLVAVAAIVLIEEEDTPAENKSAIYRRVHYRYSAAETRTTWATPDEIDRLISDT